MHKYPNDLNVDGSVEVMKSVKIFDDAHHVSLIAPTISSDVELVLPSADGTADQILKTDGSGNLSFVGTLAGLALESLTYATASNTATDDGDGTGTIADAGMIQFVTVDWDGDSDHILVLPAPTPGTIVIIAGAATGGELRSSAPATVAINGGTAENGESAIGANTLVVAICESATSWKAFQIGSDGSLAQVEAAA
jgi:hypothetical protein